ncbi:MAG: hypothetical protein WCD18_25610 [Thermosynechococcaceae cyanobacterium]
MRRLRTPKIGGQGGQCKDRGHLHPFSVHLKIPNCPLSKQFMADYKLLRSLNLYDSPALQSLATQAWAGRQLTLQPTTQCCRDSGTHSPGDRRTRDLVTQRCLAAGSLRPTYSRVGVACPQDLFNRRSNLIHDP